MKALTWVLALLILVAALALGGRAYAAREMSSRAVTPKALGAATPATQQLPYSRLAVQSGERTLIGWWVPARADSDSVAPAVLFLHGNRSSISDYVGLQKFFHRQGISTLVFDYSGFGASGGEASLRNAVRDAGRMARVFADSAGAGARKVAMGSALGATVLLQAIDSVQPHVNGVIIEGVDASVRDAAVRTGRIPRMVAPLLQELGDNVAAASRVEVPLLAIHSYADARAPLADAQKVVAAVPRPASLVRHWRRGHSALLSSSRPCDWAPALAFIRAGTLPAARLDTVDACKAEAARLAADSVRRVEAARAHEDSLRQAAAAAREARARATARPKAPTKTSPKTSTTKTKTAPARSSTKSGAGTKRPTPPS